MSSIAQDIADYEHWLRDQCAVVEADLDAKHRRMRKSEFDFLRATYFRWARKIEELCPDLNTAPQALCIGDIHVENYGTWRDADARLVWGINDFDESAVMPYAFDLIRLATSAVLAPDLDTPVHEVAAAVLEGYAKGLAHPHAMLLDEAAAWLRPYVNPTADSNRDFWDEAENYPDADPPQEVKAALTGALPAGATVQRFASRRKGGGSLGRARYLVIASWNSGRVIREAKALVPSAWAWAHQVEEPSRVLDVAFGRHRSPDPCLGLEGNFVLRRIAPDSRKIDVSDVKANGLTKDLLAAMAADLAAVHAASKSADRIAEDMKKRPGTWLREAIEVAEDSTRKDFDTYRASDGAG